MIEPRHIELALDVIRGKHRLKDLGEDASTVDYVIRTTPDAKLSQIAAEQRPHIRHRAWSGPRSR